MLLGSSQAGCSPSAQPRFSCLWQVKYWQWQIHWELPRTRAFLGCLREVRDLAKRVLYLSVQRPCSVLSRGPPPDQQCDPCDLGVNSHNKNIQPRLPEECLGTSFSSNSPCDVRSACPVSTGFLLADLCQAKVAAFWRPLDESHKRSAIFGFGGSD